MFAKNRDSPEKILQEKENYPFKISFTYNIQKVKLTISSTVIQNFYGV